AGRVEAEVRLAGDHAAALFDRDFDQRRRSRTGGDEVPVALEGERRAAGVGGREGVGAERLRERIAARGEAVVPVIDRRLYAVPCARGNGGRGTDRVGDRDQGHAGVVGGIAPGRDQRDAACDGRTRAVLRALGLAAAERRVLSTCGRY